MLVKAHACSYCIISESRNENIIGHQDVVFPIHYELAATPADSLGVTFAAESTCFPMNAMIIRWSAHRQSPVKAAMRDLRVGDIVKVCNQCLLGRSVRS